MTTHVTPRGAQGRRQRRSALLLALAVACLSVGRWSQPNSSGGSRAMAMQTAADVIARAAIHQDSSKVVVVDEDEHPVSNKVGWATDFGNVFAQCAAAAKTHAGLLAIIAAVICTFLATEENYQPPVVQVPIDKRPDYYRVCVMAALLCAVSGMVNAVAIIEMAGTVAHQTGNTSHFGRLLGIDSLRFGLLLLSFTTGAGVAGFSKADGDALFQRRYCPCMMSAAFGTAAGACLQWFTGQGNWATLPLWAFAQGIQNGVTSRFSSMPLRTTHHTGTMTDAGATVGTWLQAQLSGDPKPNMRRTWLLLICLAGYAAGGAAAKTGTDAWGVLAALPPALVMAVLATGVLPIAAAPQKVL